VLKENKLKGAILFGENKALSYVYNKMEQEVSKEELREILDLYIFICENCGNEYDEVKMGTLFKDLTEDWKCNCGAPKSKFKRKL